MLIFMINLKNDLFLLFFTFFQGSYSIFCFLVLLQIINTASVKVCHPCEFKGQSRETLSRFQVQLSRCHFRQCFCGCDGRVRCPDYLHHVTCRDDCISCWNPFTWEEVPPFAVFRSGQLRCECGCMGTYSCT